MYSASARSSVKWNCNVIHIISIEGITLTNVIASLPREVTPSKLVREIKRGLSEFKDGHLIDREIERKARLVPKKMKCKDWKEVDRRFLALGVQMGRTPKSWVVTIYGKIRSGPYRPPKRVHLRQPTEVARAEALLRLMAKYE